MIPPYVVLAFFSFWQMAHRRIQKNKCLPSEDFISPNDMNVKYYLIYLNLKPHARNPTTERNWLWEGGRKRGAGRMFSGIFSSLVSGRHVSCFVVDSSSGPVGTSRLESHIAITAFTSLETTGREMPAFSAVSRRPQLAIIRFLLNGIFFYCCSSGQIPREHIRGCRH